MVVLSKHGCFGDAIDAMFLRPEEDTVVRHVDGCWSVCRESAGEKAFLDSCERVTAAGVGSESGDGMQD